MEVQENNNMNIKNVREKIDNIDHKILNLISKRFTLLSNVVKYKIDNNLPIRNYKREKEILKNITKKASVLKINTKFVQKLFNNIILEAIRIEKKLKK